jgi:hypothetical protein
VSDGVEATPGDCIGDVREISFFSFVVAVAGARGVGVLFMALSCRAGLAAMEKFKKKSCSY